MNFDLINVFLTLSAQDQRKSILWQCVADENSQVIYWPPIFNRPFRKEPFPLSDTHLHTELYMGLICSLHAVFIRL